MRRLVLAAPLAACSLVTPLDDLGSDASTEASAPLDAPYDFALYDKVPIDAGSPYADKVMADAPIAYYRLDETTGTVAHDASGNHHDCTFVGGVAFGTKGALTNDANTAVTFDGASGYADCGQLFDFAATSPFTVEAWIHPQFDSLYRGVFGKNSNDPDAGTSVGMHAYISSLQPPDAGNYIVFERLLGSSTESSYAFGVLDATWMHMVTIYDGANVRVYLDAALAATAPSTTSIATTTEPFLFAGAKIYKPFNGALDEVAIYASALPPNRVLAHYNAGIGL